MHRYYFLLLPAILLMVFLSTLQARIIHVPADSLTIQGGINGAVDGDTVMVADGTYTGDGNREIGFFGKSIVVMSENGPENCIIDCEADSLDPYRGFYFGSEEDSSSVLQGFTIRNGYRYRTWPDGGAIYIYGRCSPTIRDNIITGNKAYSEGGGIFCSNWAYPTITDNVIVGNTALGLGKGGGISCRWYAYPTITGNIITGNTADRGGGIYWDNILGSSTISGNTITGNTASYGGGIEINSAYPTVINNIISGNSAYSSGGGIYCYISSSTILGNTITGNTAYSHGGGIYCDEYFSTISGNTITGNTANYGGGINWFFNYFSTFTGNTITGNTANYGGGMYNWSSDLTITNTIFWSNRAPSSPEIGSLDSNLTITYSDVKGGWPGVGNIDADPMFVLPDKRDYRLLWGSPCIDTGHPDSLDADSTRSDIGALFFNQDDYLTIYLTPDTAEIARGGRLGVTYTVINRWAQSESFRGLTQAVLPNGNPLNLLGPVQYTLLADTTIQQHLSHYVPPGPPLGQYEYRTKIGLPPSTLYDEDRFTFTVVE